ncbi:hypothetical protein VTJ83DRAFT_39 [Remersonia thermophila]|uniref:Uncharacterized protein n=1 Tax=Remersonia thermophila TaxID=72144 RepID=A0ABR4DJX6_9PEZI
MHFSTLAALLATALAGLSSASTVHKRCSPMYDPDLPGGYYPPAPCWLGFDPSCSPYIPEGREITIDAEHGVAIVYGISEHCAGLIATEIDRTAQGLKNFRWIQDHGWMTVIEPRKEGDERILVLSGMTPAAVQKYQNLTGWNWS